MVAISAYEINWTETFPKGLKQLDDTSLWVFREAHEYREVKSSSLLYVCTIPCTYIQMPQSNQSVAHMIEAFLTLWNICYMQHLAQCSEVRKQIWPFLLFISYTTTCSLCLFVKLLMSFPSFWGLSFHLTVDQTVMKRWHHCTVAWKVIESARTVELVMTDIYDETSHQLLLTLIDLDDWKSLWKTYRHIIWPMRVDNHRKLF